MDWGGEPCPTGHQQAGYLSVPERLVSVRGSPCLLHPLLLITQRACTRKPHEINTYIHSDAEPITTNFRNAECQSSRWHVGPRTLSKTDRNQHGKTRGDRR